MRSEPGSGLPHWLTDWLVHPSTYPCIHPPTHPSFIRAPSVCTQVPTKAWNSLLFIPSCWLRYFHLSPTLADHGNPSCQSPSSPPPPNSSHCIHVPAPILVTLRLYIRLIFWFMKSCKPIRGGVSPPHPSVNQCVFFRLRSSFS